MRSFSRILLPAMLGAAFTAFGCSGGPTANQATTPQQAQSAARSVLDIAPGPTMDQLAQNLPARIPASEAGKLLVNIPANEIKQDTNSFSVQARGGSFHGSSFRSFGRHGFGGFNSFAFGGIWPYSLGLYGLGSSLYYPYGNYYYPYSLYGNYYYPYSTTYNAAYYYPYLYRSAGLYNPYYWRAWL